jgi:hypothetical protein
VTSGRIAVENFAGSHTSKNIETPSQKKKKGGRQLAEVDEKL